MLTGIGGSLTFAGVILFFVVIDLTVAMGRPGAQPRDIPVSETITTPAARGWEPTLDRPGLWVAVAIALIAIAYGPFFLTYDPQAVSPGFKLF